MRFRGFVTLFLLGASAQAMSDLPGPGQAPSVWALPDRAFETLRCADIADPIATLNAGLNPQKTGGLSSIDRTGNPHPRGVVLLVHGLAGSSAQMKDVVYEYHRLGYDVVRLNIAGHGADLARMRYLNRQRYLDSVLLGYCAARSLADTLQVPLVLSGYSLGGLLLEDFWNLDLAEPVRADSKVYFAPAIATRTYIDDAPAFYWLGGNFHFAKWFEKLTGLNFGSGDLASVRALLQVKRDLTINRRFRDSYKIPVLIIGNHRDPLVSDRGLETVVATYGLDRWKFHWVTTLHLKHAVEHKANFKPEDWKAIWQLIDKHLAN